MTDDGGVSDVSAYTNIFRTLIQNEFKISKASGQVANRMPTVSSTAFIKDRALYRTFLLNNPHDLIKFKTFRRSANTVRASAADYRLNHVRSSSRLPIEVWARWAVQHSLFQSMILALIILNSVSLGVQNEFNRSDYPGLFNACDLLDLCSLLLFSLEIALHWIDDFPDFWRSYWNCFDFLVTVMASLPILLNYLLIGNSSLSKVASQLRIFRIFRSLKVVARFRNLRLIVATILRAFQNMGFVLLLLSVIAFIFCIFGIYVFEPYTHSSVPNLQYQYEFDGIVNTFQSLFQMLTLDNWYSIEIEIRQAVSPWISVTYFFLWIWIGGFIFRNIFVGVMVRNFQELSDEMIREDAQKRFAKNVQKELNQVRDQIENVPATDPASPENPAMAEAAVNLNLDHAASWTSLMQNSATKLSNFAQEQTWPSDDLFNYFQLMMKLQENGQELIELQYLCGVALSNLNEPEAPIKPTEQEDQDDDPSLGG